MKASVYQNQVVTDILVKLYKSRLPGGTSKRIMHIMLAYQKAAAEYDKKKGELQKKYGQKDDKGELVVEDGLVKFTAESRKKFDQEYEKLIQTDYSVGLLTQADVEQLSDISGEELKVLLDAGLISAN